MSKSGVKTNSKSLEETVAGALTSAGGNGHTEPGVIALSTGVRLQAVKFPKMLIADVLLVIDEEFGGIPKVPVVMIADKGRAEENPDDPDYQSQVRMYQGRQAQAINDVLIMRGTKLLYRPKAIPDMDDEEWIESEKALRMRGLDNRQVRYLLWIKHVAAPDDDDVTKIVREVGGLIGINETDVNEAVKRIRS